MFRFITLILSVAALSVHLYGAERLAVAYYKTADGMVTLYTDGMGDRFYTDLAELVKSNPSLTNDPIQLKNFILDQVLMPDQVYRVYNRGIPGTEAFQRRLDRLVWKNSLEAEHQAGKKELENQFGSTSIPLVKGWHILISEDTAEKGQPDLKAMDNAEKAARDLDSQIRANGGGMEAFRDAMNKVSNNNGLRYIAQDLGLFTKGVMVEPFEKAVFSAVKPGMLDNPVRTPYGWHLVYLLEAPYSVTVNDAFQVKGLSPQYKGRVYQLYLKNLRENTIKTYYRFEKRENSSTRLWLNGRTYENLSSEVINPDEIWCRAGVRYIRFAELTNTIELFIPQFSSNMNLKNLEQQARNFNEFYLMVLAGREPGVKTVLRTRRELSDYLARRLSAERFQEESIAWAESQMTPQMLTNYYEMLSPQYAQLVIDKNGHTNRVLPGLEELRPTLEREMLQNLNMEYYEKKKAEFVKDSGLTWNESAIMAILDYEGRVFQPARSESRAR